jgi:hypothetical protein
MLEILLQVAPKEILSLIFGKMLGDGSLTIEKQGNKKVIPFEILSMVIDEAGLAWWYQDDGHLKIENNKVRKIILSTDNFSKDENEKLVALLKHRFDLSFALDGQNRLCLYDQIQILYFLYLVKPFIHFSMERKNYQLDTINHSFIPLRKRTTISLPDKISIKSPTNDINTIIEQIDMSTFIQNWFKLWYKEKSSIFKSSNKIRYQIAINKEQLVKIEHIKNQTGLNMNDIVYLASIL